jgi:hypothetical protein
MKLAQAQRAERDAGQPFLRERSLELERRRHVPCAADGGKHADRLVPQAAKGNLEHARRRRVEPLDVVERDHDRASLGKRPQDGEQREPDRVRIGSLLFWLDQQERDFERTPPDRRQRGRHLVEDRGEQIGESGEGEGGLGLGPSVKEDTREMLRCLFQAGLPEDRLADPRLAGEDKRAGTVAGSIQERLDRAELLRPPDDLFGHQPRGIVDEVRPDCERPRAIACRSSWKLQQANEVCLVSDRIQRLDLQADRSRPLVGAYTHGDRCCAPGGGAGLRRE